MPMPVKLVGGGAVQPAAEQTVGPLFGAGRTELRPLDYTYGNQVLGHYRATLGPTGTTVSVTAKSILAYGRWAVSNAFMVLMRASVLSSYVAATITTGTIVDCALYVRRGSTAAGSGGNAVTTGGSNQKNRVLMGASQLSDLRFASTGALTAPTSGTQDANPIGYTLLPATFQTTAPASGTPVTATIQFGPIDLYKWDTLGQHPIVLTSGEDIEFCEFTAGPATGGIAFSFLLEWAEVAVF